MLRVFVLGFYCCVRSGFVWFGRRCECTSTQTQYIGVASTDQRERRLDCRTDGLLKECRTRKKYRMYVCFARLYITWVCMTYHTFVVFGATN